MNNASNLIGNTPVVEVPSYKNNRLHLKLEGENPGLSIKDRVAFHICDALNRRIGLLDRSVVEYSSGNLAIGLAQASMIWKFRLTLIVTSKTSPDKIKLLKRFGAELIMVDESVHSEDPLGFRGFAEIIANTRDSIFIDQFNNPLNPEAHMKTTGPEIQRDVPGVDYVFSPMGTGGTACGTAQYFKQAGMDTKVVGVTPDSGIYYTHFHDLPKRNVTASSVIEGVGEDFIPKNLNMELLASVVEVRDALALFEVERLIKDTGIFVGGSSGLAIAGAKQYIDSQGIHDKNIVVMCPDSGNRYLSTFKPPKSSDPSPYEDVVNEYHNGEYPKII